MLYFDTSFLTSLVLPEPTSRAVEAFMRQVGKEQWSTSHWTSVEFASVVARHVRMKNLPDDEAHEAIVRFDRLLAASFRLLLPTAAVFELAKHYLSRFATGLRGGDALHLATAVSNGAGSLLALDKPMLKACRMLEIDGRSGIDWPGYD